MTEDFDIWWKNYPRKINKAPAQKAYEKAVKKLKVDPTVLLKGVLAFSEEVRTKNIETDYIPHASTWLNQRRWENHEPQSEVFVVDTIDPPEKPLNRRVFDGVGPAVYRAWFQDCDISGSPNGYTFNFPTRFKADWVKITYSYHLYQVMEASRIEFVSRA